MNAAGGAGADPFLVALDNACSTYGCGCSGQMTAIRWVGGYSVSLSYNGAGLNDIVTDTHGRRMTFVYNARGHVAHVLPPDGGKINYLYTELYDLTAAFRATVPGAPPITDHPYRSLDAAIYPDDTPLTATDNPRPRHHYEDSANRGALTGYTDERGIRYASWPYGGNGNAVSSEHAGGTSETTLSYNASLNRTTGTSPLGRDTVFTFGHLSQGQRRLTAGDGQVTPNCPAPNAQLAYDSNDYLSQTTDEEGSITKYTNDTRGRPTQTIEAFGPPFARTTSYTWHATFALPAQVVAPGLTTAFSYDTTGRLTQSVETDATTHTVPYATNGQTRTWTFTYTAAGASRPRSRTPTASRPSWHTMRADGSYRSRSIPARTPPARISSTIPQATSRR